jgi:hypothetical protein
MTAGDLLEQVAVAYSLGMEPSLIYELVTTRAAEVLRLADGEGQIRPGSIADFVAIPDRGLDPCEALVETSYDKIGMVVVHGVPRLLCEELAVQMAHTRDFQKLSVEGVVRLVRATVSDWIKEARASLGPSIYLAHREIRQ